ncbi:hypothetical protein [Streptomyces sp. NPDC005283]|uniref:hypothetical protein n=1 Tax=Streptomyces sp. NPDC005283 TaxID=3156871 RepID=UPI0034557947
MAGSLLDNELKAVGALDARGRQEARPIAAMAAMAWNTAQVKSTVHRTTFRR